MTTIKNINKLNKAIITGGTGMIGQSLIEALLSSGAEVTAIVNPSSSRLATLPHHEKLTVIPCDLSDLGSLSAKLTPPFDAFFHLGWKGTFGDARNDYKTQVANIQYTLDAVELAASLQCKVFLGAGSQAEYGRVEGILHPNTPTFPENGYGMAKLAAGQMSRLACEQKGIRHIWTRILSVYGPKDGSQTLISTVIRDLLNNEVPQTTPAEQIWDYLFAEDAARALLLAALYGKNNSIYCIGSGAAQPLRSYIEIIRDTINPTLPLGIGERPYNPKQVMHLEADISNLTQDTGFLPRYSFKEGIEKTINEYRKTKSFN